MTDSLLETATHATRELTKYGFSTQEFATLVKQHNMTGYGSSRCGKGI